MSNPRRRARSNIVLEKHPMQNVAPITQILKVTQQERGVEEILLREIRQREEQPRRYFDDQGIDELAHSIQSRGLLNPIIVRPLAEGEYEIVAGERRYRAFKLLERAAIPATVVPMNEAEAQTVSLMENLQREDLNPLEETEGILSLLALKLGATTEEVISLFHAVANARRGRGADNVIRSEAWEKVERTFEELGRMSTESFRVNRLPLLRIPADILEAVRLGRLAYTKARAIARIDDAQIRSEILKRAVDEDWSLSLVRAEAREILIPTVVGEPPLASRARVVVRKLRWGELPPEKQERAKTLITELEALLED